jgi:muramidase (phage lysozyme)
MATITANDAGSPNVPRFLDMLGFSEGTVSDPLTVCDGYDVIVSGVDGPEIFTDFSDHPFANRPAKLIRYPSLYSTAAGRYQLLDRYWIPYKKQLNLPDFSPLSQDLVAIQQIREHHDSLGSALKHVIAGQIETAIQLCSGTWASLPGNSYGQGGKSLQELLDYFNSLSEVTQ